jgi:hypothetical protein
MITGPVKQLCLSYGTPSAPGRISPMTQFPVPLHIPVSAHPLAPNPTQSNPCHHPCSSSPRWTVDSVDTVSHLVPPDEV